VALKALEGLKAMAMKPSAMASPPEDELGEEAADPARERKLELADELIAALKTGDREAVADVLEACGGGYDEE